MITKSAQKTLATAHKIILRGIIFALAAFTALGTSGSTNAVLVNIDVRFVQLQPDSDWLEKMDWYMMGAATGPGSSFTANLTSAQLKNVLQRLNQHDGAELINEGQVTTLNGKQVQFPVFNEGQVTTSTGTQITGTSTKLDPFKTTLNLIPTVSDDRSTIQMVLIPTVTEFLGTNQSGTFMPSVVTTGGVLAPGNLPLPHTRVRQITQSCSMKDGQTLVFGGFPGNPVMMKRPQLIFVTPIIIDSSGNPIHPKGDQDYRIYPQYHFDGPAP